MLAKLTPRLTIGEMQGHKGQLAPSCRALGTMIKKSYHGDGRLSTRLGYDAPALSQVCSPNDGKVGNPFLYPHSRCFGSYFDVNLLMYLVSSGFFFQAKLILINHPHRPCLAKSECRKVVIKHSINPNQYW